MRRGLTEDWSIDIEPSFTGRVVDGDLQLVAPGRTIWVAVWSTSAAEALELVHQSMHPSPDGRVEEPGNDDDETRIGSWYSEIIEGQVQHGLYGYTIRPDNYVQIAFLFDDPNDVSWALEAWRSLQYRAPTL